MKEKKKGKSLKKLRTSSSGDDQIESAPPGDDESSVDEVTVRPSVGTQVSTNLDSDTTCSKPENGSLKINGSVKNCAQKSSVGEIKSNGFGSKFRRKVTGLQIQELESVLCTGRSPLRFQVELDFTALCLFLLALLTRMWRLEEPRSIVFDELHYGKFASLYMKRTFFFDSHPPLGKQLIALAGYLAGYDGNSNFDRIGGVYPANVPVWALRSVPALFGSFLPPVIYYLLLEMGLTYRTATVASILVILDNALLTQSRFILMESMLLFFSIVSVLMMIKFRKQSQRPFSFQWWLWLSLTAISFTCAICIKYVGVFSAFLVLSVLTYDFWLMVADSGISMKQLGFHLLSRGVVLGALPLAIYLGTFYLHLAILTKAGPHDNVMTSAFQASLEGGLASITKGQPLEVVHGSQVTLRHTHGRACWLHSHAHLYPIRYPDKRGSSHQQQVSCYSFKDVNNWWIIKRPERNDLVVSEPVDRIKHGEVIQLIHGMSSRALNSHDVAAPMSPQHQEVSCYIDYNISFPAQNLWRVEILNKETEGAIWHTIHSHVRLVHLNSTQALKFSGKQLPEWGFNQHEVVTDRVINQDDTIWNVEEHRLTKSADQKEREREMGMAEFVPLQPTQLSFFEKIWELQYKMLTVNQENVQDHVYSSEPMEWPFLHRSIAYWISSQSNAQIHLIGNIVIWYSSSASLLIFLGLAAVYLLRRRRACHDIPQDVWESLCFRGGLFLSGYLLHLVPYSFADRTLFLHHYLPAFLFSICLLATLLEHTDYLICHFVGARSAQYAFGLLLCLWLLSVAHVFLRFSVLSYGTTSLSALDVQGLKWKHSWDLIIHRP